MATHMGREKPEQAVQDFVNFLNHRNREEAYQLLTSPERAAVPLTEWLSEKWDSSDDEMAGKIIETNIIETNHTTPQQTEVRVATNLILADDKSEVKAYYTTRLESDGWYVYLGLDRSAGTWHGISPIGF